MKNNLIVLLEQSYPDVNKFFDSKARNDGSPKWVDFAYNYWHVDCVRSIAFEEFSSDYKNWCKSKGYLFNVKKAETVYNVSFDAIAVFSQTDTTKILIQQAIEMLNAASKTIEVLRAQMDDTASKLPEYSVVMKIYGVGSTLGPQLIA